MLSPWCSRHRLAQTTEGARGSVQVPPGFRRAPPRKAPVAPAAETTDADDVRKYGCSHSARRIRAVLKQRLQLSRFKTRKAVLRGLLLGARCCGDSFAAAMAKPLSLLVAVKRCVDYATKIRVLPDRSVRTGGSAAPSPFLA